MHVLHRPVETAMLRGRTEIHAPAAFVILRAHAASSGHFRNGLLAVIRYVFLSQ